MAKRRNKKGSADSEPKPPAMPALWAWIIEGEEGRYIGETRWRDERFPGWVKSKEKAMRFSRMKDAVTMARICYSVGVPCNDEGMGVIEHCFRTTGSE